MQNVSTKDAAEIVEMILEAISFSNGNGAEWQFTAKKPGTLGLSFSGIGISLHVDHKKLIKPALVLRKIGPSSLRFMTMADLNSLIYRFVEQNFWYILDIWPGLRTGEPLSMLVTPAQKALLSKNLLSSEIVNPEIAIVLYPLSIVTAEFNYSGKNFYICDPKALADTKFIQAIFVDKIKVDQFPPFHDWPGRMHIPSAWLGVRAPSVQVADKMKAGILGALALTPIQRERHMFTGRTVASGRCMLHGTRTSAASDESITPPLGSDIILRNVDASWLDILDNLISSDSHDNKRKIKALEYYYRSWFLPPHERFVHHCMSADAMFSEPRQATKKVVDGLIQSVDPTISDVRVFHLMQIRGSVVHGRAPDVYDADEYDKYYEKYEVDPVADLELLVNQSLRSSLFSHNFRQQDDPHAEQIARAQAAGVLSKDLRGGYIISQ